MTGVTIVTGENISNGMQYRLWARLSCSLHSCVNNADNADGPKAIWINTSEPTKIQSIRLVKFVIFVTYSILAQPVLV